MLVSLMEVGVTNALASASFRADFASDGETYVNNVRRISLAANLGIGVHDVYVSASTYDGDVGVSPTYRVTVTGPSNGAQVSAHTRLPATVTAGVSYNVSVTMLNTGTTTWVTSGEQPYSLGSVGDNGIWNVGRVGIAGSVAPGASYKFDFVATAPAQPGTYNYRWGMVQDKVAWFGEMTGEPLTVTVMPPPSAAPTITVSPAVLSLTAGQGANVTWSTTNATSVTRACVASGTGYSGTVTLATSGTRTETGSASWAGYPSSCTWTATGAGGSATFTQTMTTAAAASPAPTITVSPATMSLTAGQGANVTWSTTNATSVTRACVASGTGYSGTVTLATSGTRTETASASWAGYPSSCTWTATGAGGSAKFTQTMTTSTSQISSQCLAVTPASGTYTATLSGGAVWGNNSAGYTTDSSMAVALTHSGLLVPGQSGQITVTPLDILPSFTGTIANGVTTSSYATTHCAMRLSRVVTITPGDGASFVTQNVPATMRAGQPYTVTVTMQNTGTTTWTSDAGYRLGARNPQDSHTWVPTARAYLSAPVASGGTAVFTIPMTAPSTAGTYNLQWRMVREGVAWFGESSANLAIAVGTGPGPAATLTAESTNRRVLGTETVPLTFSAKGVASSGTIAKLELFKGTESTGFSTRAAQTLTGSAAAVSWSPMVRLPAGVYLFKLRATDSAGVATDSAVVMVNITDLPFSGTVMGLSTRADKNYLLGWVCQSGAAPMNYQLLLDAPTLAAGATLLESGVANVGTEGSSTQEICSTPGVEHFFAIDLSPYTQYAGRQLYVRASDAAGTVARTLPCPDNICTMPGTLRMGISTPLSGATFYLPNPAFLRLVVAGATAPLDEVGFLVDGNWTAAKAEADAPGAYSVSVPLAAIARPYYVQAKVRQGNVTLFSTQNKIMVSSAAAPTIAITAPAGATTAAPGAVLALSASASGSGTPASVKFFANGAQIGVATSGGGSWNYNWTTGVAGPYNVVARSYDAGGAQLAESAPVAVTVGGSAASSATPLPVTIAPPHLGNADAGSLPGSLDVGNSGNAVYSMPLAVPPGTAGMQPNLSLNYSSDAPNGMVGLGWSLGGLSTIHRCAKTIAQDGMAGRINFDGGDRLCLDGQRLVLASAANSTDADVAYWATGAQYRTEFESFARVTRLDNGGFKVETKPGLIQWYGIDATNAIAAQGRTDGKPLLWALARTEDRSRNYMTYEYSVNAATGEYLPTQIRYGGNAAVAPAQAADLAVRFEYADRGDQQQRFIGGSRNDLMKRLTHIRTFVATNADGTGGTLVRDHTLQYKTSVISGRSMLESMQACAADPDNATVTTCACPANPGNATATTCLPKTVFDWGGAASLAITRLPGTMVYPIIPHPTPGVETIYPDAGWHMSGNLDGKGRTSFITAEYLSWPDKMPAYCGLPDQIPCARFTFDIPPGVKWKLSGLMYFRLSDGTEFNRTVKPTLPIQTALIEISQYMLGDLDGDGRDDLVVVFDYWAGELGYEKRESGWNYCLNKAVADGTMDFECHTGGYGPLHHAPTMVDLQGDRRMDLLMQGDTSNARMACSFPNGVVSCVSRTVNFTTPQPMLLDPMQFAEIGLSAQGANDLYATWRTASPVASGTGVNIYGHWPDGWGYHQAESTAGAAICLNDKQGNYLCDKIYGETSVHAEGSSTPASAPGVFGVQAVGDLNGDSLADFVFTVANSQTGKNGNYVCLSKETGVRCALDPELERLMPASATSQGGKIEALPFSAISSLYNVPLFMDDSGMPTFVDGTSVYIKDVDTPGYQSGHLLWTRWRVSMAGPAEQDRLVGVTNGFGQQDKIDYARGDDATVYRRFAQVDGVERRPVYPQMSEPLGAVVRRRRQSNGQGGWLSTSYRYEGAMSDAEGRGSLGFTKLGITDEQTGAATELVLRQDYPYVGQVASRTVVRGGVALVTETVTSDVKSQSLPSGARTVFPYVKLSETKNRDLINSSLGTTTVATEYDGWGNQKLQTVTMADGAATSMEVTSAIYTNDESAWLLGLPTHTTITRSASDAPAVTRTVDVEYEPLTGLRKSLTVEPDSPTLRVRTDYGRAGNLFGLINTTTRTWIDPSTATSVSDKVLDTVYDAKGRFPVNISNALGHTSVLEHYAGTGARRKVTDANNLFAAVKTDGFGRVKTTSWSGGKEEREYDKQCADDCPAYAVTAHVVDTFMVDTLNGASRIVTPSVTYMDSAGHVVRTMTWGMDGQPIMSDRVYDPRGRLFEVQRPRTDATVYLDRRVLYDDFDRVTSVVTLDDDGTPRTQIITYRGFVTTTVDAKSHARAEGRDMAGRIVFIVDAKGGRTTLNYDAFGNLVSTIDPMNNTIKVEYDRLGRKTDLRDPNLGWLHYDVNPIGQVWRQISQKQRDQGAPACGTPKATCFKYDKLGRLVQREEPDLRGSWVYDTAANGKGRLAEAYTGTATAPDYRRVYAYDNLGRHAGTTLWLTDGTYTDTPAYDAWGRLVRQSYRRGTEAAKVYDLRYDDKGMFARLERAGAVLYTVSARDAAGRLRKSVLGNGLVRNMEFSPYSARLTSDELTNAGAFSLLKSGYFHDAVGNLERRTQYWDAKAGQARPGFDESFHYDELNRLKDSQVVGQALQEFLYDAAGNITSKTGVGVYGYTPAGANAVQNAGALGAYTYDKNGNVLTGGGRTNTWTSFDMPYKLAKGTDSATFIYGPEHQRVRQDRSDGVSVVYAGGQEVELKGGQVTSVKTFWPMGDGVEIDRPGTATELLWVHKDRLGSPIAYSTASGEMKAEKLAYDAWGRRRYAEGAATPDSVDGVLDTRGYTDHEMLDRLDLVHMNGRVYDPLLGRFLSADPYIADPSNSQNYSRYTYVSDNPTNLTDPDGYAENCGPPACEIVGQRPTSGPQPNFPSWYSNFERIRFDANYANMFADTIRKGYAQAGRMARYAPTVARLAAQKSWKKMAVTVVVGGGPENPVTDVVAAGLFVATAWEVYHVVAAADQGKDPADAVSNDSLGTKSAQTKGTPDDPNDPDPEKKNDKPDLKKIHSDETIKKSNKTGYDYWKNKSTDEIVRSLRPGQEEPLTVKPDGRVYQGNTRVLILEERGVNVNSLPRDIIR